MFDKNSLTQEQKDLIIAQALSMDGGVLTGLPPSGPPLDRSISENKVGIRNLRKKYRRGKVSDEQLYDMHYNQKLITSNDYERIKRAKKITDELA